MHTIHIDIKHQPDADELDIHLLIKHAEKRILKKKINAIILFIVVLPMTCGRTITRKMLKKALQSVCIG